MWSDNDIDSAFQRLNPPEPEPTPFPLDAWLRLESQLDQAVIERAVRRRLWQFFAAQVAVVLLVGLGWLLLRPTATAPTTAATALAGRPVAPPATGTPAAGHLTREIPRGAALASTSTSANNLLTAAPNAALVPVPAASAAASRTPQASSTASPTASPDAVATGAPAVFRLTRTHPIAVTPTPALTGRSRTRLANAESSAREQGSAGSFGAATGARNVARPSRERMALAGRHVAITSPDEATATTTLAVRTPPKPKATGPNPSVGYAVAAETHKPANAQSRSTRPTTAPEATAATAGSAIPQPGAEASTVADGFAPLALRPVLPPPAESASLPTPLATVALAETPPPPEVPKPAREPRFYVALVGAPDVSTVKFAGIEKPLANVGLLLEYRLSRRLRLSTGLLRSTKQYVARRADYDFGAYAANVAYRYFNEVAGSCTVLDVPLNLRYDLLTRPRYRLYGSAGLSSFFMQRERYSYAYTENYRPGYWQGEWVNANRHYFSILNLSAGYERALSTHWSLQAEPYLKIPLAGVGHGKLRLTSAGVFFGVKYGL